MNADKWKSDGLCSETYNGYIQERTLAGARIPNKSNGGCPTVQHMHLDAKGVDYVFANCRHCMNHNFTGGFKTGMDPGVMVDDLDSPRLGRCGCVCCTKCVLVVMSTNRGWGEWVSCPACGHAKFQHSKEIFWIMNAQTFNNLPESLGCP